MNEILFCLHIFSSLFFLTISLRLGKESITAFLAVAVVLANLFVVKQMDFFYLTVTCADVYAVQAILALNILQEYYGQNFSVKASYISFICMFFFTVMSQFHLGYIPSFADTTQHAFGLILHSTPRIAFASIFTFFVVQRLDILFFAKLRKKFAGKYFPLRTVISLFCSQTIDTVLFGFLGLYGIVEHLAHIILFSLFIKCLVIWLSTPITFFAQRFLEKHYRVQNFT